MINVAQKQPNISVYNCSQEDGRLGIDSHADMSCAGSHARIVAIEEGAESIVH